MANLATEILGIRLKSPILAASGTFGYGDEMAEGWGFEGLGAIVTKSLTLRPREGNPPPRIVETAAGMLNSIGLQNIGIERFIAEKLPVLARLGIPIIANIAGSDIEEYLEICRRIKGEQAIGAIEINISCPNVKAGGMEFGRDPETAKRITRLAKEAWGGKMVVKLSPNVTDIAGIARSVQEGGADAITVANTFLGMAIDVRRRRPALHTKMGGLSGPAIKPLALRCVWQVAEAVSVPVIGSGGICTGLDAAEFLLAGARAVAVGTAHFIDPNAGNRIGGELSKYMDEQGFRKVEDIIRAGHRA